MDIPADVQNQIAQFQQLQQQLQMIMMQKQQFETQMKEFEKAIEEMAKSESDEVFKMAGGILIKRNKDEVKVELEEKLETLSIRVATFAKQEEKMQKRYEELQETLQKALENTQ
ncbi:prefoldin subunit beta [Methanococcus voltae]|jgi:prefoldin beta subunit|uniref:Prefoldin subunit beta n=2 Tax=Methanococcus voltae TaxID=2188 RepID=A0A8J7RZP2_METVO|nr:prefoldin subunit beta [Methanococcus voltae]MBP2172279.1 prefoldin beta subunit [Methanococcus voltae]MBP2200765.1 prefoldin beta subunit [Methanococcus voltae]MCS3921489.1 prefoldin beta subunit [Methanococcus voltae PS]